MLYVWLVVGLVLVVAVVLVALGRGDAAAPAEPDGRLAWLPDDRAVTADDVDALRLPQSVRGYRAADVDAVLDRLAAELRRRDALHAGRAVAPPGLPDGTPGSVVDRSADTLVSAGVQLVVPLPPEAPDPGDPAPVDATSLDPAPVGAAAAADQDAGPAVGTSVDTARDPEDHPVRPAREPGTP